jgi:hypothetical protein
MWLKALRKRLLARLSAPGHERRIGPALYEKPHVGRRRVSGRRSGRQAAEVAHRKTLTQAQLDLLGVDKPTARPRRLDRRRSTLVSVQLWRGSKSEPDEH